MISFDYSVFKRVGFSSPGEQHQEATACLGPADTPARRVWPQRASAEDTESHMGTAEQAAAAAPRPRPHRATSAAPCNLGCAARPCRKAGGQRACELTPTGVWGSACLRSRLNASGGVSVDAADSGLAVEELRRVREGATVFTVSSRERSPAARPGQCAPRPQPSPAPRCPDRTGSSACCPGTAHSAGVLPTPACDSRTLGLLRWRRGPLSRAPAPHGPQPPGGHATALWWRLQGARPRRGARPACPAPLHASAHGSPSWAGRCPEAFVALTRLRRRLSPCSAFTSAACAQCSLSTSASGRQEGHGTAATMTRGTCAPQPAGSNLLPGAI